MIIDNNEFLFTEKNNPFIYFKQNDDGSFILSFDSFIICNGCFIKVDENLQDEIIIEDSFNIIASIELSEDVTKYELELFKIEENKIPQEVLNINYIWRNHVLIYKDELGLFKEDFLVNYLYELLEESFNYDIDEFLNNYSDDFVKISNFINENYSLSHGETIADVRYWVPYTLKIIKNYNEINYIFINSYKKIEITYSKNGEFFKYTEAIDDYQPQLSFDDYGKLVVSINGVTKEFAPINMPN